MVLKSVATLRSIRPVADTSAAFFMLALTPFSDARRWSALAAPSVSCRCVCFCERSAALRAEPSLYVTALEAASRPIRFDGGGLCRTPRVLVDAGRRNRE